MSKNMSFGDVIWTILGAILLFLILKSVFRGMDTILDTIIPLENESLRMIAERIVFVIVLGSLFLIPPLIASYVVHRKKAKESSWPALAASKHLTFVPGKFFGHEPSITGTYRYHRLKLETFIKSQGKRVNTYTRLSVSVDTLAHDSPQQVSRQDAISLLTPTSPHYILKGAQLKGSITDQTVDQTVYVCYEQEGIEDDSDYLGYLFDLFSDLAEAYSAMVALGGEIVPCCAFPERQHCTSSSRVNSGRVVKSHCQKNDRPIRRSSLADRVSLVFDTLQGSQGVARGKSMVWGGIRSRYYLLRLPNLWTELRVSGGASRGCAG